jgi:hypothetical protein
VTSVTVSSSKSGENAINSTQRACLMSDTVKNTNSRLEKLVRRIMKEEDPVHFDSLCSELWRVLDEPEVLTGVEIRGSTETKTAE